MTDVRADSAAGTPTGRDAVPRAERRYGRKRRGERLMVPKAEFRSYYGRPVIKKPIWSAADIAGYLFLGGTAGASSTLAAAATLSGRPGLARAAKIGAATAIGGSLVALVHDLGRPGRFVNMLRVLKVTSPMSVGSWLLAGYAPQVFAAAGSEVTGLLPGLGTAATVGAGLLGPAVATYTAPLLADTAVPTWHGAYRELPFVFAASAATSAGGVGLMFAPAADADHARRVATAGVITETLAAQQMRRRLGDLAEPLRTGRAGLLMRAAQALGLAGATLAQTRGRRSRPAAVLAGAALVAASACTRFGIFAAGVASAEDPRYTVEPQRARRTERDQSALVAGEQRAPEPAEDRRQHPGHVHL
jgi:formate-dependent nitrite reductase membrane component NrfD